MTGFVIFVIFALVAVDAGVTLGGPLALPVLVAHRFEHGADAGLGAGLPGGGQRLAGARGAG